MEYIVWTYLWNFDHSVIFIIGSTFFSFMFVQFLFVIHFKVLGYLLLVYIFYARYETLAGLFKM